MEDTGAWHAAVHGVAKIWTWLIDWTELTAQQRTMSQLHLKSLLASPSFTNPQSCSNLCPMSRWCHQTVSSSVFPFSSHPQSFPASVFSNESALHISGQSIGTSASASVLSMSIQDWFPVGLTGLISLLSKGLSRIFSSTAIRKHQLFGAQPSLWSNYHIPTWLWEKTMALTRRIFVSKVMSLLFNALSRFVIAFLPRSFQF